MVLVDEEGTRIHATVDEELIAKHKGIRIERKSLSINCFIIKEYYGDFRTTPLPYKIALCRTTRAKEINDFPSDLPEKYLSDFKSIKEDKLDKNALIDVIGKIVTVGSMEVIKTKEKSGISEKLMITLRDTNDVQLKCTLWGQYAKATFEYTDKHMAAIVVCVMRFVWIKEYKGDISISDAFNSTKILFDPDFKIMKDFREKLPKNNQIIVHVEQSYSTSWGGAIDYREEFLGVKNRRRRIAGIRDTKVPCKIVTCIMVKDVDISKLWYYWTCKPCNIKVLEHGIMSDDEDYDKRIPLFSCKNCGDIYSYDTIVASYYIVLFVTDDSDVDVRFLMFDDTAQRLLGHSAESIMEQNDEFIFNLPRGLPDGLTKLLTMRMLFKITVSEEHTKGSQSPYVVELWSQDVDIMTEWDSRSEQPLMLMSSDELENPSSGSSLTPSSKKIVESERFISDILEDPPTPEVESAKLRLASSNDFSPVNDEYEDQPQ
ncbi:uncharacterized protein LOC112083088 [Eutrema salsugineum]|uniref:uncharacterized protein LOC112083088 n=1 Tax=Eutrema salsugineum TaxID=72664 RepID=UPI000CED382C|nr:uncharacterized protein LOC112083088 [Eutrema salsugineum]